MVKYPYNCGMRNKTGVDTREVSRFKPDNEDMFQRYIRDIRNVGVLDRDEEAALFRSYRESPSPQLLDRLCRHNLFFVISVARKYAMYVQGGKSLTFEDLVCSGNIGLITAVNKFDPERGFKFISYAVWHIMSEIRAALANQSTSIRMPLGEQELRRKCLKEIEYLEHREQSVIDRAVVLEHLIERGIVQPGFELWQLEFMLNFGESRMSTVSASNSKDDKIIDLSEMVPDEGPSSSEIVIRSENSAALMSAA